jgi:hypothetical protein
MWERCTYPKHAKYHLYGGRGITVCERWRSFAAFIADMGPRPSLKHSIERKDANGSYEPGNCEWATQFEQMRNTSANLYLTLNGKTQIAADWSRQLGVPPTVLIKRKLRGWSDNDTLTIPVQIQAKDRIIAFNGQSKTITEWARSVGLNKTTLFCRLDKLHWSIEKALTTPGRGK